ncbi:MAG: hypothetical protein GQ550_04230 [Gammaproteobacteria bacterium]|nr:hypothetical protein [Gammaproteobacteria bacterium]
MSELYKQVSYIVLAIVVLAGCSINDAKDEGSVFYAVPVGSTLVLNQQVNIRGDQVAVYVQNGELMQYDAVNFYLPNCKFEIYTMSEQPRTVDQDSFEIVKVEDDIESSALQKRTYLAAMDSAMRPGVLDKSYVFNYATMMYLRSEQQKDVYRMTCQHWEDVMDDRHLSITQMRQAMGDVFTLIIKKD